MSWVRLDDQWADHPKFADVPDLAQLAWVKGLTHAARYLTDGFIKESVAPKLLRSPKASREATKELIAAGLWKEVAGGYQIHDYSDYQPLASQVKAQRQANRERVKRFRNASGNGVTPGITNDAEMSLVRTRARVGSGSGSGSAPEGSPEGEEADPPESVEPEEPARAESGFDLAKRIWLELWSGKYGERYRFAVDSGPRGEDKTLQRIGNDAVDSGSDAEALLRHKIGAYLRDKGAWVVDNRHPLRGIERDWNKYGLPRAPTSVTRIASTRPVEPPPLSAAQHLAAVERARNLARGIGDVAPKKESAG